MMPMPADLRTGIRLKSSKNNLIKVEPPQYENYGGFVYLQGRFTKGKMQI